MQLRVGRRSVCQSFVWTSRSARLIVPTGIGIRIYAYTLLAASIIIVDSQQRRSRVNSAVDELAVARAPAIFDTVVVVVVVIVSQVSLFGPANERHREISPDGRDVKTLTWKQCGFRWCCSP